MKPTKIEIFFPCSHLSIKPPPVPMPSSTCVRASWTDHRPWRHDHQGLTLDGPWTGLRRMYSLVACGNIISLGVARFLATAAASNRPRASHYFCPRFFFFYISGFRFRFLNTPSASLSITHEDGTALVGFGHPSHDRDSASKKKKLQASFRLPPRLLDPSRRSTLDTNSHDPPHRRQDTHRDRRLHRTSLTRLSISSIFSRCSARCPPTELFAPHITICYLSRARAHTHTRARVLASSYPFSYFRVIICSRTLARFVGRALLQCLRCLDERAAARR